MLYYIVAFLLSCALLFSPNVRGWMLKMCVFMFGAWTFWRLVWAIVAMARAAAQ